MSGFDFDLDRAQRDAIGRAALRYVDDFLDVRGTAAASDVDGALELAARLVGEAPPEDGRPFDDVLATFDAAATKALDPTNPGYLAFIPGGGLYTSAVADFLACVTNRFVNLAATSPALVALEASVIRWLCATFGLPSNAQGILTSGGSMANFSALVAARESRLPEDFLGGTLYVSDQAHQSVVKAARLAGFPAAAVRVLPTGADLTLDPDAVRVAVAADRAAGRTPFCVVASAGTTNTGAVDPLPALADVARDEGLWLHVDAAYGGFFRLTARGRERLAGIERADSITLDPHKGMFLPYGTGCLLVRDGDALRRAHQVEAHYLQDVAGGEVVPSFADYSPELTRDFRGLRVWLPLQLHGVAAFRATLDEKLDLAEVVHRELAGDERLEVPWEPALSIVAFRLHDGDDDANRRFLVRINASRRVYLSSTVIDDRVTLRVCVLCHRTHRDRIDEAISIIRNAV